MTKEEIIKSAKEAIKEERKILWIEALKDEHYCVYAVPCNFYEVWNTEPSDTLIPKTCWVFDLRRNPQDILERENIIWTNPMYEDLINKANDDNYIEIVSQIIMRACQLKVAATPSSEEFCLKLTTLEKEALEAIYKKIGVEGNISIVKMIQETTISRPIWTALLGKMKEFNFAQVENQGVKGTHIKFLN